MVQKRENCDTIPIATISIELLHFVFVAKAIYQFYFKLPTEAKRQTIAGISPDLPRGARFLFGKLPVRAVLVVER